MIVLSDILKCMECGLDFSKCGIMSHVRHKHNTTYNEYKKKHNLETLSHQCLECGILTTNKIFCSRRCTNVSRSKRVKKHKNKYSTENSLEKQYVKISSELKNKIINDYETGFFSIKELVQKFSLNYDLVKMIFKKFKVEVDRNKNGQKLKEKYEEKTVQLAKSEIGKQIVDEYENQKASLRKLSEKYKVNRGTIRRFLEFYGVKKRSCKDAVFKSNKRKQQLGIRHSNFGKPTKGGKVHWYLYKGTKYQGSWEFLYALYLESKNIKFVCHKGVRRFEYEINDKILTYCPDFYLKEFDEYIEIKGYFSKDDQIKIEIVKKTYPDIKFVVLTKKEFVEQGILKIDKLLNVNIHEFELDYKKDIFVLDDLRKRLSKEDFIQEYLVKKQNFKKLAIKFSVPIHIIGKLYTEYKIPKLNNNKYSV